MTELSTAPDGPAGMAPSTPTSARSLTTWDRLGPGAVALVVGGSLAALAQAGAAALLVGVAVTQGLLVVSWVFGSALPGRIGAIVLGGLAAAAADVVVSRWPGGQLGTLLAVAGLVISAMFVHQLTRGVVRTRVVESLSDIAFMIVCVLAATALLQLRHEASGQLMTTAVLVATTAALVVQQLADVAVPVLRFDPAVARGLVGVGLAICVAAAAAVLRLHGTVEFTTGRAAFLGAAVGAAAGLLAVGAGFIEQASTGPTGSARRLRVVYTALVPLTLSAPVSYLLCLAIRG